MSRPDNQTIWRELFVCFLSALAFIFFSTFLINYMECNSQKALKQDDIPMSEQGAFSEGNKILDGVCANKQEKRELIHNALPFLLDTGVNKPWLLKNVNWIVISLFIILWVCGVVFNHFIKSIVKHLHDWISLKK